MNRRKKNGQILCEAIFSNRQGYPETMAEFETRLNSIVRGTGETFTPTEIKNMKAYLGL